LTYTTEYACPKREIATEQENIPAQMLQYRVQQLKPHPESPSDHLLPKCDFKG